MAEADPDMKQDSPASVAAEPVAAKRKWKRIILMVSVPLIILLAGFTYWLSQQGKVWTDNAYVKQDKVSISSEIGGRIVEVLVKENQTVSAGDLLFRIDPEPYRLDINEAVADIASAQANVTALSNDSALSGADIAAAREDIAFTQATLQRQQALWERGFATKADLEAAEHSVAQAREELRSAEARQREARAKLAQGAAVPGQNPQIAVAQAKKAQAEYNLQRTEVRAPMAGRIGEAGRLQPGQQLVAGLPVLTLVADNGSYVEANFKETDLDAMTIGQRAQITFDAYPELQIEGHVASIGAGTSSEFSVLPAQNATGNWVKVTQRVPVRIELDEQSPRQLLAGLSAEVTVFTADGAKQGQ